MSEELGETKGFLKGLIWGILLAIAGLIFLETERGGKLKKKLEEEGEDLLDNLPELLDKLEEKGEALIKEAQNLGEEIIEKKDELEEAVVGEIEKEANTAASHIVALQEHGREITSGIKRRLFKGIPKKTREAPLN